MKQAAKKILRQHLGGDEQQKMQVMGKLRNAEQKITQGGQKVVSV